MTTYSATNPLPMRISATDPPVEGDHIDIGVWPGGWKFLTPRDQYRFDRLPHEARDERTITQDMFIRIGKMSAEGMAQREDDDTSEDLCTDHGFAECPDCGNAGTKIGPDGYEPCTRFLSCWTDPS